MRKLIVLLLLMMTFVTLSAQNKLKPIDKVEQKIWGEKNFQGFYDEKAWLEYLVFPSFSEPSALYMHTDYKKKFKLIAKKNKKTYEMDINEPSARKLWALYKYSINVSSYLYNTLGCDGVKYFFFNGRKGASTWSPHGNCARMVDLMNKIIVCVEDKSLDAFEALMPEVDSLTKLFKGYYPADIFEVYVIKVSQAKRNLVELKPQFGHFYVEFECPENVSVEEFSAQMVAKYGKVIENVARDLFVETSIMDTWVRIRVDFKEPDELTRDEYAKIFVRVKSEDLTEDNLKALLLEKYNSLEITMWDIYDGF